MKLYATERGVRTILGWVYFVTKNTAVFMVHSFLDMYQVLEYSVSYKKRNYSAHKKFTKAFIC
jgi:hypothetical protein